MHRTVPCAVLDRVGVPWDVCMPDRAECRQNTSIATGTSFAVGIRLGLPAFLNRTLPKERDRCDVFGS